MLANLHTCNVTFDIGVACPNCALLATARCEGVEMHSEEKVRRAGTRERVCMCASVAVECGSVCLCVCVWKWGAHIVAAATARAIVAHLQSWLHVSLQPEPVRL